MFPRICQLSNFLSISACSNVSIKRPACFLKYLCLFSAHLVSVYHSLFLINLSSLLIINITVTYRILNACAVSLVKSPFAKARLMQQAHLLERANGHGKNQVSGRGKFRFSLDFDEWEQWNWDRDLFSFSVSVAREITTSSAIEPHTYICLSQEDDAGNQFLFNFFIWFIYLLYIIYNLD